VARASSQRAEEPRVKVPYLCHQPECCEQIPDDVFLCALHYDQLPQRLRQELSAVQKAGVKWTELFSRDWAGVLAKCTDWLKRNEPK
jgi:hypothetical protein